MICTLDIINGFSLPIQLYAFSPISSLDKRIQNEAHTAFTFSNIKQAIIDEDIIMPLNGTFAGYKCAMILVNEMPIELIATTLSEREIWGDSIFKGDFLYSINYDV